MRIARGCQVEGPHRSAGGLVDVHASLTGVVLPDGPPGQGQNIVAGNGRSPSQHSTQPSPQRSPSRSVAIEYERTAGDEDDWEPPANASRIEATSSLQAEPWSLTHFTA